MCALVALLFSALSIPAMVTAAAAMPADLVSIAPADGAVVTAGEVTLSGALEGAVSLEIDGRAVELVAQRFSAGPYPLDQGVRVFALVLVGPDGESREILHRVVRDSIGPRVEVLRPRRAIVGRPQVAVAGVVSEARLASLTVGGSPTTVEGGRFEVTLELADGVNRVPIEALDDAGNRTSQMLELTLDREAPRVIVKEAGERLDERRVFARPVTPRVTIADATEWVQAITVDGRPWESGSAIAEEGDHRLTVRATDAAGNRTVRIVDFEIDRVPPRFGRVSPNDGLVTAAEEVVLTGTLVGAVQLTVNGVQARLDGATWAAGPFPLADGESTFALEASDAAGNIARRSHRLIRDASPPALALAGEEEGVVRSSTLELRAEAGDGDLRSVRVDGRLATVDDDGSVFSSVPLAEGENTIRIEAEDTAGNTSVRALTVVRDTTPPKLDVSAGGRPLASGGTFNQPVQPVVSAADATEVQLQAQLDGRPYVPGETVTSDGRHELEVTATDAAGNSTSVELPFSLNQTGPTFGPIAPASGAVVAPDEVTLVGTVAEAVSLTVDGQAVTLVGDSFSAGPLALVEGSQTFTLVATDSESNTTQVDHTIVRDSVDPQITVSTPAEGLVVGSAAIDVSGSVVEPHLSSLTVNGVAASLTGGNFLASQVPLVAGNNQLLVRATDAAGNLSEVSRTVHFDGDGPMLVITDPAGGTVVPDPALEIRGTADDPHLDRVSIDGVPATVDGSAWALEVALAEGANTIVVDAYDTVGNSSQTAVTVTRDNEAPAIDIEVPVEALHTTATAVTVSGTVADEAGIVVSVNGVTANVTSGTFEAVDVPLVEGENRLIARATDAQGNEGTHTRLVYSDTAPPSLIGSDPAAGALAVWVDTIFRVSFTEAMAEPDAAAWRLETATGSPIAATLAVDEHELVITPASELPSETDIQVVVTGGVTDLAGNAVANPQTLSFTTEDIGAPPAPVVQPLPPPALCAATVTLAGSGEFGTTIHATGGAAGAETEVLADGSFALPVSLLPETLNRLDVFAIDHGDNTSAVTLVEVVHDCTPPQVLDAVRLGDSFQVLFSEVLDASTLPGTIAVDDDGGLIAGSAALDGAATTAIWTADLPLPANDLRLTVADQVSDPAGNELAFPYVEVFADAEGESFFSGTAIDDSGGRPLAGALVTVTASDGVATVEPRPEFTTLEDGRFVLALAAGTHDLTFTRPGYTPVFRVVTTAAGLGTDVFDPRLTPAPEALSVDGSGGNLVFGPGLALDVPANAVAAATAVELTSLSQQGLAALLPYGWTPRGAVWLELRAADESNVSLAFAAELTLPVSAPAGTHLTWARLDLATLQWQALDTVLAGEGEATAGVTEFGGYALVEADGGALAPPPAVLGQILGSSPAPIGDEVTSATLTFDPEVVLPTQTSVGTATYSLAADVASGAPLTLLIAEELQLLDGTIRNEAPFQADLVLYRDATGAPASDFNLTASAAARILPLEVGTEDVRLQVYADESVRGNVIGPQGGSVVNPEGDRVDLPPGALDTPVPVELTRLTEADLPLAAPAGAVGVLELSLAGAELLLPADLSLFVDPAPAGTAKGLLLQVVDPQSEPAYRAVAAIEPTVSGWSTQTIDPQDLAWPGVTTGGLFVFVELSAPHGYLRGDVLRADGVALADGLVTSAAVEWLQLSNPDGSYVLPLPVAQSAVQALNLDNGNTVDVLVDVVVEDERIDLDLALQIVAPFVVEFTPLDGAVDVAVGVQPLVRFSEAVAADSLAAGIQLLQDGEEVAVAFDAQGALVHLLPISSLAPEATIEVRVTTALRDLHGYYLPSPVSAFFTTQQYLLPDSVDLTRVMLIEPDPAGFAQIVGLAGAVPSETLVFVENITSYVSTESTDAGADGSFDLTIESSLDDRLMLHVLIEGGNEVVAELTPFMAADMRTALVDDEAVEFSTIDGVTVKIEAGTFDGATRVHVEPQVVEDPPTPIPDSLEGVVAFALDFEGAVANKPLTIDWPAPEGIPAGATYLVTRVVEAFDGPGWMVHDFMELRDGMLTNEVATEGAGAPPASFTAPQPDTPAASSRGSARPPAAEVRMFTADELRQLQVRVEGMVAIESGSSGSSPAAFAPPQPIYDPGDDAGEGDSADGEDPDLGPREYFTGPSYGGSYQISYATDALGFASVPFAGGSQLSFSVTGLDAVITVVNAAVERLLGHNAIAIPALLGQPFELIAHDLTTGYEVFRVTLDPPVADELLILGDDIYDDSRPPYPVSGNPLSFYVLETEPDSARDIDIGLSMVVDGDGALTVTGDPGTMPPGMQVHLAGLDDGVTAAATAGALGEFTLEATVATGRYLLMVGSRIRPEDALEISFNEALATDTSTTAGRFELFELLDNGSERAITVTPEPIGTYEHIRLEPQGLLEPEASYVLRLTDALVDVHGNAFLAGTGLPYVEIPFEVAGSTVLGTFALGTVRDMERLGNLLFVAADTAGLQVVDATDPTELQNYLPADVAYSFAYNDPVRGVAIDPHGRVLFVGGGIQTFGTMTLLDPLAIDLAAIAADPDNLEVRHAALKGTTILSDALGTDSGTQLYEGTPRKVTVLSNDLGDEWRLGGGAPSGFTVAPATPPSGGEPYMVTISGTNGATDRPVTVRNRDRGSWNRVDADASGAYSVEITAREGDLIEVLRNVDALAYVTIDGIGIAVVDFNDFYNESITDPAAASSVLRYHTGFPVSPEILCDSTSTWVLWNPVDIDILLDDSPEQPHQWTLPVLIGAYGLGMLEIDRNSPVDLDFLHGVCGEQDGYSRMAGMDVIEDYPIDLDADGLIGADESRDYAAMTHLGGWLIIVDVTDRANVQKVGVVQLPGPANQVVFDRLRRQILVSSYGLGVVVVEFDAPPGLEPVDEDEDGLDDRILEVIEVPGDRITSPILLVPELGIGYAGGLDLGVSGISFGGPEVQMLADNLAPASGGGRRRVDRLAPFGVPSAPETTGAVESLPGAIRLQTSMPGHLADLNGQIPLELVALGPGGLEVDGAGDPETILDLPPTRLAGLDAIQLTRLADNPWEEGYSVFESEPVVLLADLRASIHFERTSSEDAFGPTDLCPRCDLAAEGVYDGPIPFTTYPELLSGHQVGVRFPDALRTDLAEVYDPLLLGRAEIDVESVPWDTSRSVLQEPTQSPSFGAGGVVGTLLHSGEMTHGAADLQLRGRGLDLGFDRSYRNQTLGAGPLGPGWDHGYRLRLRELPDGNVQFFDGSGRIELFTRQSGADGTYESPPGRFAKLLRSATGFALLDAGANLARFDRFGRLTGLADAVKLSDTTGTEIEFTYDLNSRLIRAEAHDRELSFDYDADGRLTALGDHTGRTVSYAYDADGRLETVTSPPLTTGMTQFPDGLITTYGYETPGSGVTAILRSRDNLSSVTDARGENWLGITYGDDDGDGWSEEVTAQTLGGAPLSIAYTFLVEAATDTTVTDSRGHLWRHEHDEDGRLVRFEDPWNEVTLSEYDSEGHGILTRRELPSVRVFEYEPDLDNDDPRARGNILVSRELPAAGDTNGSAAELVSSATYHQRTNQPVTTIDRHGTRTEITRESDGLPRTVTVAAGDPELEAVTTTEYNAYGQPTRIVSPKERVTEFEYFEEGVKAGFLKRRTDDVGGLDLTTSYLVDDRGNVTEVTDTRGVRHESDYNELGWKVEDRLAVGVSGGGLAPIGDTTSYLHDANGNVLESHRLLAAGSTGTSVTKQVYGPLNEVLEVHREIQPQDTWAIELYDYDLARNLIKTTGAENQVVEYEYDERGQRDVTRYDNGAFSESTVYDVDGRVSAATDANGKITTLEYDGYGRRKAVVDPLLTRTEQAYDLGGRAVTQSVRDSVGNLLARTHTDYDALGRSTATRPLRWEYEGSGTPEPPAGASEQAHGYEYDVASNLVKTIDPRGHETERFYDTAGRLERVVDAAGNETVYQRDAAGNVLVETVTEVSPTGSIVIPTAATYDALGRTLEVMGGAGDRRSFLYDIRGNLTQELDGEGNLTAHSYDSLGRKLRTVQPENVAIDYTWDRSSRLVEYRDAADNPTTWAYDALDRKLSITYPDTRSESWEYDNVGNPTVVTRADGTVLTQAYDDAHRLTSRTAALAPGVEGPTTETFGYDAVGRLTQTVSGTVASARIYDSLSQVLSDQTAGRTVAFDYDAAGNVAELGYPSGRTVLRTADVLNRPQAIEWGNGVGNDLKAAFSYQGRGRIAGRDFGNGVTGTTVYDGSRRPVGTDYRSGAQAGDTLLGEQVRWDDRDLKRAHTRVDLGGRGLGFDYDGKGRVKKAERVTDLEAEIPLLTALGNLPEKYTFDYDAAENLIARQETWEWGGNTVDLPVDSSGRNRPGSVNGVALEWDDNGNLTKKGDKEFFYDFRNRLVRVADPTGDLAKYEYDSANRRVKEEVDGKVIETTWSGWQPIEEHHDGQLFTRRTYGAGLDEVVRIETDLDGDGTVEQEYVPLYDLNGNPALVTDAAGNLVERYEFSPYGRRSVLVDSTPPAIHQARIVGDELWLEASEEVLLGPLTEAVDDATVTLTNQTTSDSLMITVERPVESGRQRGRRLVIAVTTIPTAGDSLALSIPAAALKDLFDNQPSGDYNLSFAWPAADAVLEDSADPELQQVALLEDHTLEVQFSEPVGLAAVTSEFLIDSAATTWLLDADGYTVRTDAPLAPGSYDLALSTGGIDLAGKGVVDAFTATVAIDPGSDGQLVLSMPLPGVSNESFTGNRLALYGLLRDSTTGLIYMRNRYYDPAVGRFITTDPKGFIDGPSPYQYALNSPINYADPLGEEAYLVYRPFAIPSLRKKYPKIGHIYLAFDDKGLADPASWNRLVGKLGDGSVSASGTRSKGDPQAETFSFHPWQVCTGETQGNVALTLYTKGSCVDHNNRTNDQEPFELMRDFGYGKAEVLPLNVTQDQQESLYRQASLSRDLNNSSQMNGDIGNYSVLENNCGSWAKAMVESVGIAFPPRASEWNMGAGVGGIQDHLPFTALVTGTAAVYGCTVGTVINETGGEYFNESEPGRIYVGVKWGIGSTRP